MSNALIKNTLKALPGKPTPNQIEFLEELAQSMTKEDQDHFDPELLAKVVQTHWKLGQKREDGEPKLKICTVTGPAMGPRKTIIDVVSDDKAFLVEFGRRRS